MVTPQRGVPVVTIDVTYDVGSRVEPIGKTGLAHLFEHLMFEGSENLPKGEHFRLVTEAGGVLNGTTSEDRTNYFETIPAEALDLGLYLEADRMRALAVSQEKLDNQRLAVKEEKRLRIDNEPYAPSFVAAEELAYDGFPYHHPVIGSMEDLDAATLEDAISFYRRYYSPGNALLCVSGDVEPERALERVRAHFESVPARQSPELFTMEEPTPCGERRREVADPHAALPAVHVTWKVPPRRHPDVFALTYVDRVLSGGESSRLWRRLVKDGERALSLSTSVDERRGPSLFRVFAVARPGVTLDELETDVRSDVARMAADGPSDREMERARRTIESEAVRATQTTQAVAFIVSEYGLYDGDPGLFSTDIERLLTMTRTEVREAAERCLRDAAISVVHVLPAAEGPP